MEHIDHILVVDDDRDIRELIVDYLAKSGYRATGAANGKEMRIVLDKQHIDLVVLDVMMPGDDGLTLCRELRVGRAQILASISHDLQTPITRMKLRVEMAGEPELRDKLLNDLDNMSRLVREGIAYARSSESLEETSLKLELNAWINSIACDYQDIGKNVHFQAGEARLPIVTRPQALRRVMTNLLDNALKFGEHAAISVDDSSDSEVIIHIVDDGPGIPEAELEAVLQPFYRVETSRNRETGGTGLGLAIAAQLTAQLEGKLRLANRNGGGLDVSITLPRRE
uniref:ATP-binding protein n=1 Tax=Enterobacter vonholyi TaxID=2797505 RepID=UPI0035E05C5B